MVMMIMVVIMMMVVMPMTGSRAAHLVKSVAKRRISRIQPGRRFFDQPGNILKPFFPRRRRPFDKLRLMAPVMLNPMGQKHPQFFHRILIAHQNYPFS